MSSTPLERKLGLKPGMQFCVLQANTAYMEWVKSLVPHIEPLFDLPDKQVDIIHIFCLNQHLLEQHFLPAKERMRPDSILWISWPKKASKIESDLNRELVRDYGLANGLVDVKVASIDEHWSALKFVFRLKDRPANQKVK